MSELKPIQATPPAELEAQIMSYNVPKNEREWWAQKEIERLRSELAAARAELAAERGRLEWALGSLSRGEFLTTDVGCGCCGEMQEIPAGQSARDVIDRLRGEGGDAQ